MGEAKNVTAPKRTGASIVLAGYDPKTLTPGQMLAFDPPLRPVNGDGGATGRRVFELKALAQAIFATDPRVQAIVNRVTETETPTAREWRARAKPICLVSDVSPASLPEVRSGCIVLAGSAKFELIEPRAEIRKRRAHAFEIAWGRERALRHEAIRRALVIWRGAPR